MRDAAEHARMLLTVWRQQRSRSESLLTASWQERGSRYGVRVERRARRNSSSVAHAAMTPSASGSSAASSK